MARPSPEGPPLGGGGAHPKATEGNPGGSPLAARAAVNTQGKAQARAAGAERSLPHDRKSGGDPAPQPRGYRPASADPPGPGYTSSMRAIGALSP